MCVAQGDYDGSLMQPVTPKALRFIPKTNLKNQAEECQYSIMTIGGDYVYNFFVFGNVCNGK